MTVACHSPICGSVEAVVNNSVDCAHSGFRRDRNGSIDIEVIFVEFEWLYAEQMLPRLLHCLHKFAIADILRVETISKNHHINTGSLCGTLQCNYLILFIFIIILGETQSCSVILPIKFEDNLSATGRTICRLPGKGELYFALSLS